MISWGDIGGKRKPSRFTPVSPKRFFKGEKASVKREKEQPSKAIIISTWRVKTSEIRKEKWPSRLYLGRLRLLLSLSIVCHVKRGQLTRRFQSLPHGLQCIFMENTIVNTNKKKRNGSSSSRHSKNDWDQGSFPEKKREKLNVSNQRGQILLYRGKLILCPKKRSGVIPDTSRDGANNKKS
jgi:hypothetical protein